MYILEDVDYIKDHPLEYVRDGNDLVFQLPDDYREAPYLNVARPGKMSFALVMKFLPEGEMEYRVWGSDSVKLDWNCDDRKLKILNEKDAKAELVYYAKGGSPIVINC